MKQALLIFTSLLLLQSALTRAYAQTSQTTSATQNGTASPDLEEASRLNSQVVSLLNERRFDEALSAAKRAVALTERASGTAASALAYPLLNLAETYVWLRKFSDAKSNFLRVLKIYEQTLATDDARIANVLERLGLVELAQSKYDQADEFWQRSLSLREHSSGSNSPELSGALLRIADFYLRRNQFNKAEPLYKRLVAMSETLPGRDNEGLIEALNAYSTLLYLDGRNDEAIAIQRRIASLRQGSDVPLISIQILNGRALSMPRPEYPEDARAARARGMIHVRGVIDETGHVIVAKAQGNGHPSLKAAAERAAMQARFTPTKISGMPIRIVGEILYNFIAQ